MTNPPKPDLSLYSELPQGCLINYNNKFNLFQIYRAHTVIDEHGKKKTVRETIGSIKDGVLKLGRTYLLKQQNELLSIKKLQQRCADVKIGIECIACALGLLAE